MISKTMQLFLKVVVIFLTVTLVMSCKQTSIKQDTKVLSASTELQLVWSDEFDNDGLPDPTKWNYDVGDGCPRVCGWGNNELQYYTDGDLQNGRVGNGNLIIEAHKFLKGGKNYTSARLTTKGKGDWQYGKISIRAQLPTGLGTWPAIWMLPTESKFGNWPNSGEIDIMEHVGYKRDTIYGSVHTTAFNHMIGTQVGKAIYQPKAESTFKTYSIEWDENQITWSIDGEQYHSFKNRKQSVREWPFDERFHLILNIAVGGNWGGKKGIDTKIWPQKLLIDWVRVYQRV